MLNMALVLLAVSLPQTPKVSQHPVTTPPTRAISRTSVEAKAKEAALQAKIEAVVFKYRKSKKYASEVATHIVNGSKASNIDPLLVTAVALCESNFDMNAGGQIGVMQFTRSTFRSNYGVKGYNAHNLKDNIYCGANYLANKCRETMSRTDRRNYYSTSRGGEIGVLLGPHSRANTVSGLVRYNGSSSKHRYARKVMSAYDKLRAWEPSRQQKCPV